MLANEPRAASVVATTDVALLKMSKDDFEKTMGPLAKYLTDKARTNYGLMGPATKDIKLSDLKIVRAHAQQRSSDVCRLGFCVFVHAVTGNEWHPRSTPSDRLPSGKRFSG